MLKKTGWSILFFVAIILIDPVASSACPGCNALNNSLGRAFNPSVLFMMAMPFAVVGSIAGGLFYAYRRAQKQMNKSEQHSDKILPSEKLE